MKKILFLMAMLPMMLLTSCSSDDDSNNSEVQKLPKINNISLNYHSSEQTIFLPRDVASEGATIALKDDSY